MVFQVLDLGRSRAHGPMGPWAHEIASCGPEVWLPSESKEPEQVLRVSKGKKTSWMPLMLTFGFCKPDVIFFDHLISVTSSDSGFATQFSGSPLQRLPPVCTAPQYLYTPTSSV